MFSSLQWNDGCLTFLLYANGYRCWHRYDVTSKPLQYIQWLTIWYRDNIFSPIMIPKYRAAYQKKLSLIRLGDLIPLTQSPHPFISDWFAATHPYTKQGLICSILRRIPSFTFIKTIGNCQHSIHFVGSYRVWNRPFTSASMSLGRSVDCFDGWWFFPFRKTSCRYSPQLEHPINHIV